eukprot:g18259.t1
MLHHGLGLEVEKKISGQKSFCQPTATPSTFDFALDFLQRMELGDVCIFLLRLLLTSCHQSNSTFSAGVDLLEELYGRERPDDSLSPDNTPPIEDPEAHRQREVVAFGCGRLLRFLLHAAFCTNTHQPHLHDAFSLFSRTLFDSNGILVLLKYLNQEFSSGTPEQMAGAGIGNEGVGEAPGAGVLGSRSGSSSFFSVGGLLEKRLGSLGIVEEAGKGDAEKRTQEAASIINCNCDEDDADAALASPPRSQHSGRDDTPQNSPKIPPLPEPETPAKLQALTCRDLLDCLYLLSVDQPERVRKILLHYKAPFILKRFAFTEKERYLRLMKLQCRSTVPLVDDFLLDQPSSELGDEYDEDEILTTVPFETIRKRHLLMSLGFSVEEEGGPGPCDVFPHVHYKYFVDRGNMEIPWFVQRGSDIQRGEELEKWAVFHSVADIAEAKHKATRNEQFCGENVVNREERFLVGDAGETERESISSGWKEEGGRKLKAEIESDDCLARLLLTPGESPDDEQERWNDDEFEAEAGGLNMEKSPMLDSADFTMLRPPAWLTAKSRNRQQQENEPSAGGDDLQSAIDCEFDNDILAEIEYESGRYARAFPDDALRSVIAELLVKSSIKTLTNLFFSGGIHQKNRFSPLEISIITVPERDFCIQQNWQDEVEADIGLIEEVGCGGNNGNNGGFGEEKGVYNYSPRGENIHRSKASSPDSISKNVEDIRSSPESGAKPRSSLGESEKAAISRPSGAAGEGGVEADGKAWLESALFDLNLPPSEHLNQHRRVVEMMDIPTLIYEKKRVKDKLKEYDTWFQQSVYSRKQELPNRREKEPMRPLYTYYRLVKMFLEARQSGEVAGSATNSTRGPLGGNNAAEELVPAPGMKGEVERHSQSPPPARQRRSQTTGVAGSLVNPKASASAHTGTSVEVQHLVSRRQELLRQKSRIRETLQSYQERFLQEHQRKIRYHRDILPIEGEYKNYKNIKLQLQEVERALGVELPAA